MITYYKILLETGDYLLKEDGDKILLEHYFYVTITLQAKARITATTQQTIQSKASIKKSITQTIQSKASIRLSQLQTVTAKGDIKNTYHCGVIYQPDVWTVQYEANELPEDATPAWTKTGTLDTEEINPAGYLHLVENTGYTGYTQDTSFDTDTGFTVEAKINIISDSGYNIYILAFCENGQVWMDIYDTYVQLGGNSVDEIVDFDTSGEHTYRMTIQGTTLKLYVDNKLLKTVIDTIAGLSLNYMYFGVYATTEVQIDYLYYRTDGAYPPIGLYAKARIQISREKTINTKARIQIITIQLIDAKARIQTVTEQTVEAKAAIKKTTEQQIDTKARISIPRTQTINAKTRITTTQTQTIKTQGDIKKITTQTISAKGRIQITVNQTIQAKADVLKLFTKTISAKSRIVTYKVVEIIDKVRDQKLVEKLTYVKEVTKEISYIKVEISDIIDDRLRIRGIPRTRPRIVEITELSRVNQIKWFTAKARIT